MERIYGWSLRGTNYAKTNIFLYVFGAFFAIALVFARYFMHSFLRKDFGERYYRITMIMIIIIFLGVLPAIFSHPLIKGFSTAISAVNSLNTGVDKAGQKDLLQQSLDQLNAMQNAAVAKPSDNVVPPETEQESEIEQALEKNQPDDPYESWYIMLALMVIFAVRHLGAIKIRAKPYDYTRMSTYDGDYNFFCLFVQKRFGLSDFAVMRYVEPLIFAVPGFLLYLKDQPVGVLLMFFAAVYSLSYYYEERIIRWNTLNRIDQIFINIGNRIERGEIKTAMRQQNINVNDAGLTDEEILHNIAPELRKPKDRFIIS